MASQAVTFPIEKNVAITLHISVGSVDDNAYFFAPDGSVALGFLADVLDALDMIHEHIHTINGKTPEQIHKELVSGEIA